MWRLRCCRSESAGLVSLSSEQATLGTASGSTRPSFSGCLANNSSWLGWPGQGHAPLAQSAEGCVVEGKGKISVPQDTWSQGPRWQLGNWENSGAQTKRGDERCAGV